MAERTPPKRTLADQSNVVGPFHFNSIVMPTDQTTNMVMNPALIHLVQSKPFHGLSNENPYDHLTAFSEICNTVKMVDVSDDIVRLSLFPFSLGGNANTWLNSFPERTFTTWETVARTFVKKYFPQSKITQGRLEISSFKQGMIETFGQEWDRFKSLLRKTPVHGFDKTTIVLAFLGGLQMQSKMILNVAAGWDIRMKIEDGAYELIESMADNEEIQSENADVVQKISESQNYSSMMEQNRIITQQLQIIIQKLSSLPQEMIIVSRNSEQPQFMSLQRSIDFEDMF